MEFFNFDQNSNQKTEFLPIGKCLQNSSKNHEFRWLFFKNFDQNSGWKCSYSWLRNSYGNYPTLLVKSDQNSGNLMENLKNFDHDIGEKFERFRSEFWWWTIQMTMEFFKNCILIRILVKILKDFDQNSGNLMKNLENFDQNSVQRFEGFWSEFQ